MLFHLFDWLSESISALNVFRYLTFRSMAAFVVTLILVLVFQPQFIEWFKKRSLSQPIRDDGPKTHHKKAGTPTMGGVVVVASILVSTLLFADLFNPYVWVLIGVTVLYGALGFVDDFKKISVRNTKGVRAKTKLLWQFVIAAVFSACLVYGCEGYSTEIWFPFFKELRIDLGFWFIPFATLIVVASSNAVNLTDGLDGLVIGPVMTVAFAYGIIAYLVGNVKLADYLQIAYISGSGDLAIFASAIVAGGLGFLWFNSFPAQVFMGDVGSLSLGGALGMLAVITKHELVLVLAGGIFVVEALSVIIQVVSFKLTGKRVFRMAPLHHHFELQGMPEPKIIVRFWIISILLALLTLATLKLR